MSFDPGRRDFLKLTGASALGAGLPRGAAAPNAAVPSAATTPAPGPQLAMIVLNFSSEKLAFAAAQGYQGVVLHAGQYLHPDRVTPRPPPGHRPRGRWPAPAIPGTIPCDVRDHVALLLLV